MLCPDVLFDSLMRGRILVRGCSGILFTTGACSTPQPKKHIWPQAKTRSSSWLDQSVATAVDLRVMLQITGVAKMAL